jgi:hypothetical protein
VLLLATQAEPQMLAFEHPNLGRLVQPRHFPKVAETVARCVPWAADNDAFVGFDAAAFEHMLHALAGLPGCLFVTCPDIVGEGGLTDLLFEEWAPRIMRHGLPLAYVVQEEGLEYEWSGVPWGAIKALFIGCASDEEKLGERVRSLVAEAKCLGKWVHMGRVNSAKRIAYAMEIGCDSVDGTKWVRWRDTYLAEGLQLVSAPPQLALDDAGTPRRAAGGPR